MTVSEVDRLKVIERVRQAAAPLFGGTPSYKRRRGIYRALKRGDKRIVLIYEHEMGIIEAGNRLMRTFFREATKAAMEPMGLMAILKDEIK